MDLDRRTIIKGAAWSLPVVALAVAAPAAAASGTCPDQGTEYNFCDLTSGDVAEMKVIVGELVVITFVKPYPNATALNVNGQIVWKSPDSGVPAGKIVSYDLATAGICDPTFIQIDGNNTHYYGNGIFR